MATGTANLAFASPGTDSIFVDVSGQSGLSPTSDIEAYQMAEASADRTADENRADPVRLACEYVTSSSFRIHAVPVFGAIVGTVPVRWVTEP